MYRRHYRRNDPRVTAVGRHDDCTVLVGAIDLRAEALKSLDGRWRWMTEQVVAADGDDRVARSHLREKCIGRSVGGTVMSYLEHVGALYRKSLVSVRPVN
jgi:hypothetical protein